MGKITRQFGHRAKIMPDESQIAQSVAEFNPDVIVFDALTASNETVQVAKQQSMVVSLSPVFNQLQQMDMVFHRTKYHGDDWKFETKIKRTTWSTLHCRNLECLSTERIGTSSREYPPYSLR